MGQMLASTIGIQVINWLRKIEGRRTPPGKEVRLLRALPRITLVGTLAIAAVPVLTRLTQGGPAMEAAKHIKTAEIFAIAAEISLLTAVVTVAIGCVVVHIMKGPAYAADSLPVSHADRPKRGRPDSDDAQ